MDNELRKMKLSSYITCTSLVLKKMLVNLSMNYSVNKVKSAKVWVDSNCLRHYETRYTRNLILSDNMHTVKKRVVPCPGRSHVN